MELEINAAKPKESLLHVGTIQILEDEQTYLSAVLNNSFQQHPTFSEVQIQPLDITHVPQDIQTILTKLGRQITTLTAIQTNTQVPEHTHSTDEEVYFFGQNALVHTKMKEGAIDMPLTTPELFAAVFFRRVA